MSDAPKRFQEYFSVLTQQGQTLNQIHEKMINRGYRETPRTIRRDLCTLSLNGTVTEGGYDNKKTWFLTPKFNPITGMKRDEALVLLTIKKYCENILPVEIMELIDPNFKIAQDLLTINKNGQRQYASALNDSEENSFRNWLPKIQVLDTNQKLIAPVLDNEIRRIVYTAVLRGKKVNLAYMKNPLMPDAIKYYKEVNLLGLVEHGAAIYVIVNFPGCADARSLALHRIKQVELLEIDRTPPTGFDLERFIELGGMGLGGEGEEIRITLCFFENTGKHLIEMRLSEDQIAEEVDRSTLRIHASVRNNHRLKKWILGFGADVEVIAPTKLREEIQTKLLGAVARY